MSYTGICVPIGHCKLLKPQNQRDHTALTSRPASIRYLLFITATAENRASQRGHVIERSVVQISIETVNFLERVSPAASDRHRVPLCFPQK